MFNLILEKCLGNDKYKHKRSIREIIVPLLYIVISIVDLVCYFVSLGTENKINNIPFVIFVILFIVVIIYPFFAEKILNKIRKSEAKKTNENAQKTEIDTIKERMEVVIDIIDNVDESESDFYKSHYFIDTIINTGEEKLKKDKERDLIPKIIALLILPLFFTLFSLEMDDARILFVLIVLTILVFYVFIIIIFRIVNEFINPNYRTYEWENLIDILKLIKAKKLHAQEKINAKNKD